MLDIDLEVMTDVLFEHQKGLVDFSKVAISRFGKNINSYLSAVLENGLQTGNEEFSLVFVNGFSLALMMIEAQKAKEESRYLEDLAKL